MNARQIFFCFIVSLLAIIIYLRKSTIIVENVRLKKCHSDIIKNKTVCSLICSDGEFSLPGMTSCLQWLNCEDKLTIVSTISISVVKSVYLARWSNYEVVLSVLSSKIYKEDFKQNLFMIKSLASHNQVVELIGFCNNSIVTKYYRFGSALNANYHLRHSLRSFDNIKMRLNLCISYASVIEFLHSSPVGVRVMCDSNSLEKTLSQYLLTDSFEILVNDLDATPEVQKNTNKGVICGNKLLSGTFVAPEQLWPFPNYEYDPERMISYDEKTDVWKIPDVCNWFLGNSSSIDFIKYKLFTIHKQCKSVDPLQRPTASHVLEVYKNIFSEI
ncbi:protein O-mannose kinase [Parasteatoda tepidariorum]|uniref:protein O-mannose kinase n=1 Tax=Parasteatoda tepidariorum TaxID=114398 RepID=UPI00077FD682|nr:protein O-mannose kinase [Parasteatoda tepidariorum]XP_015905813.1 protein O-mannose kinase [Parasteatoda tepidariorum]XP_015905815.1 protein O-mannose kinase [Parasteatoda tepidariorum]XP_015905817.1 protein O-mannose kinase [Parasteatoda tepidariorum]XP_015905818.1 protein O-mannose kinase [Parasteatoda tepidariorum]